MDSPPQGSPRSGGSLDSDFSDEELAALYHARTNPMLGPEIWAQDQTIRQLHSERRLLLGLLLGTSENQMNAAAAAPGPSRLMVSVATNTNGSASDSNVLRSIEPADASSDEEEFEEINVVDDDEDTDREINVVDVSEDDGPAPGGEAATQSDATSDGGDADSEDSSDGEDADDEGTSDGEDADSGVTSDGQADDVEATSDGDDADAESITDGEDAATLAVDQLSLAGVDGTAALVSDQGCSSTVVAAINGKDDIVEMNGNKSENGELVNVEEKKRGSGKPEPSNEEESNGKPIQLGNQDGFMEMDPPTSPTSGGQIDSPPRKLCRYD